MKGNLGTYDRRKYIWKLIYAYILGFDVDFGHDIAVSLINCPRLQDKVTGYIAIGIMLDEKSDSNIFVNCIDTIKQDLVCGNDVREALALGTLGNMAPPSIATELAPAVIHKSLQENRSTPVYVRKKACMCLLSLMRRQKLIYKPEIWVEGMHSLLSATNNGLLLSACSLLKTTIQMFGPESYVGLMPRLVGVLADMQKYAQDYYYYMTPCPWLQVKILQIL